MPTDPTWESFAAGLADHYGQRSHQGDCVLWRVTKPNREITCHEREAHAAVGYVGLELRVAHNGQVFRTEVHMGASRSTGASRSCARCWKRKA